MSTTTAIRTLASLFASAIVAAHCITQAASSSGYEFKGGYPTPETIQKAYDDADLSRAIEAYKFFYPTVSIVGTWKGNIHAGKGGKHLILPPGYKGEIPAGYHAGTATTTRVLLMLRSIPPAGDDAAAVALLKTVKIHPLNAPADWKEPTWIDIADKFEDFTPVRWERGLDYWEEMHELIDAEPSFEAYRMNYGQLASLGIEKSKPFAPDERMKAILEKAVQMANDQMRVQSFADRSPARLAWPDRKWEWATLRPENGTFDLPGYKDLAAREKWFYQAQIESPAMFRRDARAGSLYWLGTRDASGTYLDGGKAYKVTVPLPVPAKLFWSGTCI